MNGKSEKGWKISYLLFSSFLLKISERYPVYALDRELTYWSLNTAKLVVLRRGVDERRYLNS